MSLFTKLILDPAKVLEDRPAAKLIANGGTLPKAASRQLFKLVRRITPFRGKVNAQKSGNGRICASSAGLRSTEGKAQRFLKFGFRFSMKASMPSFWSSVANSD